MLKIGLTGGIGSGKTTISNLFAELGVPVIDMDIIARQLVMPGQAALQEIIATFGNGIRSKSGELDRNKLRKLIFADERKRKQLEAILHPRIRQTVDKRLSELTYPYCIIVIPLLFETGRQDTIDRILVIDTSVEDQIKRTMDRDDVDQEQVKRIISSQVDRQTRLNHADDIIHNTDDISSLSSQVSALHKKYLELAPNF
jgi:dephospho-CoA kinase